MDHLKKSYSRSCFHSKSGLLTLIFTAVTIMAAVMMIESTDVLLLDSGQQIVLNCLTCGLYILFPVLGYLGKQFCRYQVMKTGESLILISFSINFISLILLTTFNQNNRTSSSITFSQVMPYVSFFHCVVMEYM